MNRRIHTEVISFGFYEHFVGVIVVGYTSVVTSSFLRFKHQHKMKRKIISREYTVHMYIRYEGTISLARFGAPEDLTLISIDSSVSLLIPL